MRARLAIGTLLCLQAMLPAQPAWQRELGPLKPGAWPAIKPCALEYQVSWKGMLDSGRLRVEFSPPHARKRGTLVARSHAQSTGAAATLFPHRSDFWSELDPATLRPSFFKAIEKDRRETVETTVRHLPDRIESRVVTRPARGGAPQTNTQAFHIVPMHDIFSALLHVRSQRLATGDRLTLALLPFVNPYLLRVTVVGREMHRDTKTIRLSVELRKIDRQTQALRPYRKMTRPATLWLSDDDRRVPVELRAAIFIGDVRAVLTGFQNL